MNLTINREEADISQEGKLSVNLYDMISLHNMRMRSLNEHITFY